MKKLLLLTALMMTPAPYAKAENESVVGREDGVGAGGSGGNPSAHTMGIMGLVPSPSDSTLKPASLSPAKIKPIETVITVNREELLKAVDAALNSTDIEMEVDQEPVTVRLQKFDLSRGILHGQVLETNKSIRLIDEAKAAKK